MAEPARQQAQHVLDVYASNPGANLLPKIEAEARIDLAHAHVMARALDAAEAALAPVFDIAPGKRVHGVTGRLLDMRRALTATPLAGARQAQELGARIEAFSHDSAYTPALPPTS